MKTNRNIRTTNSQVMDLKQLIAGPLIATIDADSLSTRRYLDCLFEIAFEHYDKSTGKTGSLRTLSFTFVAGSNGNKKKQKVTIPILTLVPLPLLQVKEADFDFDIKILDAQQQSTEEAFSLKEGKLIPAQEEAGLTMRASLAPKQDSSSAQQGLSANMKIKIKMQQADMPGGLSNLLHLTANNVIMDDEENDKKELPKD
ncbi:MULTISPECIES: DUF2589 domain-containing protein [unclassified Bacteroides]|jgi:hypothetical protein|uniref:DUF2589 domain-containing protein n=1 Tax=unclassified Bacteroides TaxID=2646097 RepID=UPI000E86BFD0|nr:MULTISPECIES: DUF2589 domain-containing protein [unclassified Bacteroides]RGN51174.1 DUF2589 domain-containing protein [Bacteroides sp. OM05-12]RHR78711.1 DUF2589 domain-containing protein [Bacteroides sp. AF16-49]